MTPMVRPSCVIGIARICRVRKPVFLSQEPSKLRVGETRASSAFSYASTMLTTLPVAATKPAIECSLTGSRMSLTVRMSRNLEYISFRSGSTA